MIFEILFHDSRLFRYTVTGISSRLRRIATGTSSFWTRIEVYIDESPDKFGKMLECHDMRSRDQPLDISIFRTRCDHPAIDTEEEGKRMELIMKTLINPRLHRIQSLFIILAESSLPSFPDAFRGSADNLETLELIGRGDDIDPTNPNPHDRDESMLTEIQFPKLTKLEITGRNCQTLCTMYPQLSDLAPNLKDLDITSYTPRPGDSPFTTETLMRPVSRFSNLETLTIYNIELRRAPPNFLPPPSPLPLLKDLHLYNINSGNRRFRPIADIFEFLDDPRDVRISRCPIGFMERMIGHVDDQVDPDVIRDNPHEPITGLELVRIDNDSQDFISFLDCWSGGVLSFISCPGFNDNVLDEMASPSEDGGFQCAPELINLTIIDCPDFSVAALKRLVSARDGLVQWLTIGGHAPYFSLEDKAWFNMRGCSCNVTGPEQPIPGSYLPPSPTL
jgi:hypothetical protein